MKRGDANPLKQYNEAGGCGGPGGARSGAGGWLEEEGGWHQFGVW